MKAVLDTKPASIYDDDISRHYHFPRRYLGIVERASGDWIILRRPRADGGNLAYFAVARIESVDTDRNVPGMSYARFSDFLPFDGPVAWKLNGRYAEEALRNMAQKEVGVYLRGRSVRPLTDEDFVEIVLAGLHDSFDASKVLALGLPLPNEVAGHIAVAETERVRQVERALVSRIVRDANFRKTVCNAYNHQCAVTRVQVVNSAGNYEVQAAHIRAVSRGGPDVIGNGIALSSTVHWLFDNHLISFTDDYRLLVNEQRVPAGLRALLVHHGKYLSLPDDRKLWPNTVYLAQHREIFLQTSSI